MATTNTTKRRSGFLKVLRDPSEIVRMILPRFSELHQYAGSSGRLFWVALFLSVGVFALQLTAGSQLQTFVDSAVHNPTSRFDLIRALALFWLYNNFALPGLQAIITVLLSRYYARIVENLTNFVYERMQKVRIQNLRIRSLETLLTTQINSIWDGLKNGQRQLIVNIGKLLGALVIIWRIYGPTTGPLVVLALIVVVVALNQTLGRGQYHRLASALSIRSLTERLLRHYVRLRGLFYHWRHRDLAAQKLRIDHVTKRSAEAVQADMWSEVYQFTGIATLSLVILASASVVIVSTASFTTLLSSIVLLVTQGETFISALDALTKGVAESQSIEVGAQRLHNDLLKIPPMEHLSPDETARLLQGDLLVRLAAVECGDVYTGLKVLYDVNLAFHSGEIVVMSGGHKAGKTEIVDAISGVILPILGDVFFNGKSTSKVPFYAYGTFPKKVFNLDETLGNTLGRFSTLEENNHKRVRSLRAELQRVRRRRMGSIEVARWQEEMRAIENEQRKLQRLRRLADELARELGMDQALKALPQGYEATMYEVTRRFSEDHKWGVAFMRSLLMPVAAESSFPRLMILDQSLDELNEPEFASRVIRMLRRLAHQGMLILITSAEPDDLSNYGLHADQWVDLSQFRPLSSSGSTSPRRPVVLPTFAAGTTSFAVSSPTQPLAPAPNSFKLDITAPNPALDVTRITTRKLVS